MPNGTYGMPWQSYAAGYMPQVSSARAKSLEKLDAGAKTLDATSQMTIANAEAYIIYNDPSGSKYNAARQQTISELIASDKSSLTLQKIENKTLGKQVGQYLDS